MKNRKKITIPFNKPALVGNELEYIRQSLERGHISGDGDFTKMCNRFLELELGVQKSLLTTSCTHALEMAAILLNLEPGDENLWFNLGRALFEGGKKDQGVAALRRALKIDPQHEQALRYLQEVVGQKA